MIIVSQDKDAILNFDNVITIRTATDIESKKERLIAIDTIDGERYYIAKYATEERTKEVLQEIIRKLEDANIVNLMENLQISLHDPSFGGSIASVYIMPKE